MPRNKGYVKREYIVTSGYSTKSVALRYVIKQFCGIGAVLHTQKPLINIGDGTRTTLRSE